MKWTTICDLTDIFPGTGVCALHKGEHVALFRPLADETVYAVSNIDPFADASVMSRGITGEKNGAFYVASPLLKQRYLLASGECMDDENAALKTYKVRVHDQKIQLA
ncbi:nitrite reductase small subunit NirD [Endozoicomonas sp. OPT23]|uniref:nitrite reductase small subunit NirD n=1 Tax=Endozoicomonas sp. OPT23 TaxID=2072845 RepID=UPI00129AE103|nr:nitrite reductase small subunit NirD [Endozoicomonas sp. OPT23]